MGGAHFESDEAFVASAVRDVRRLERLAGLDVRSRVLDWGCGVGRLNVGIRAGLGGVADYHGVDVQKHLIEWADEHLADDRNRFTFVDLANARYNPDGAAQRSIPGPDGSVDVFYAFSVFSHMLTADVAGYLGEVRRLLAPRGRAMVTAFVEEDVPDCTENPVGYGPLEWVGALHCVRYERRAFENHVRDAGLAVDRFVHGREADGQSLYVLRRRDATGPGAG